MKIGSVNNDTVGDLNIEHSNDLKICINKLLLVHYSGRSLNTELNGIPNVLKFCFPMAMAAILFLDHWKTKRFCSVFQCSVPKTRWATYPPTSPRPPPRPSTHTHTHTERTPALNPHTPLCHTRLDSKCSRSISACACPAPWGQTWATCCCC